MSKRVLNTEKELNLFVTARGNISHILALRTVNDCWYVDVLHFLISYLEQLGSSDLVYLVVSRSFGRVSYERKRMRLFAL